MAEFKFDMVIKGVAQDAHTNFPIRYDVSESGKSFFIGCKLEGTFTFGGNEITKRMDIRAFDEVADQLAHVQSGDVIEIVGSYDMQKSKDGKYFPVVTVREVVSA